MCNRERSKVRKFVESGIKLTSVKLQLNLCPSKSTTPVLKRITRNERKALDNLSNDTSIVIKEADKGEELL